MKEIFKGIAFAGILSAAAIAGTVFYNAHKNVYSLGISSGGSAYSQLFTVGQGAFQFQITKISTRLDSKGYAMSVDADHDCVTTEISVGSKSVTINESPDAVGIMLVASLSILGVAVGWSKSGRGDKTGDGKPQGHAV